MTPDWKPADIIVLIITVVVGLVLLLSVLKPFLNNAAALPPESAKLVAGILASMIAIISIGVEN